MPLPVEAAVFALIGLLAAAAALLLVPEYFPMARSLTVATALVSALLSGLVSRFTLAGDLAATLAATALCTGLLTSVLARPDLAAKRGSHRRRRHAA